MFTRIYTMILSSLICLVISIVHQRYAEAIAWLCCIFANIALILSDRRRIRDLDMEKDLTEYTQSRLNIATDHIERLEDYNERLIEHAHANDFRVCELRTKLLEANTEIHLAQKCTLAMEHAFEEQNNKLQDAQALNEYLGRVVNNMDSVISLDTKLINSLRKTNDMQAKQIEQLTGHLW